LTGQINLGAPDQGHPGDVPAAEPRQAVAMLQTQPSPTRPSAGHTDDTVVSIDGLRVRYGDTVAVDGVSLSIRRGEIFGILGPNGAGKTTTVECLAGLRRPDAGTLRVLGHDVLTDHHVLRELVGVQLQTAALPEKLRVGEAIELFASFYPAPADPDELLDRLGLRDKRATRFDRLSGGQRQRLSIALALVGSPKVAILDELTTGLDPQARRETWKLIESVRDQGVTVVLVTHFMEEAERLCDRIALLHHGRVLALDTPAGLTAAGHAGQRIAFTLDRPDGLDLSALRALPEVRDVVRRGARIEVAGGGDVVAATIASLVQAGAVPRDTRIEQASLDDAFVELTTEEDR
jgi:ABC-2 type transport system ATP-binding protein